MAESAVGREELTLPVDWGVIDACNGFSFDMGGSVMKIAFVDKQDWVEPKDRKQGSKGCIRMVNFSRKEIDAAFDFINKRVRIPPPKHPDELPEIYTTGFGGSQFAKQVVEKIKVKNNQLLEMDCFNESLLHLLRNVPRKQVLHPVITPVFETHIKIREFLKKSASSQKGVSDIMDTIFERMEDSTITFKQLNQDNTDKPLADDDDIFPCGIMMCGSAFVYSVVQRSGANQYITMSFRGGKMFLALGSLLTGAQTYDELMDLAEKGNAFNVCDTNMSTFEGIESTGERDTYSDWSDMIQSGGIPDDITFAYGKALGKQIGDFKREDLARHHLEIHASDLVDLCMLASIGHGIRHVFFCGGFTQHPLARRVVTDYWLKKSTDASYSDPLWKGEIQIHFPILAQSLGAIGALLNHKFKWSEKNKTEIEKSNGATCTDKSAEKDAGGKTEMCDKPTNNI